jgi:GDPmannose 4,6-dehydratase
VYGDLLDADSLAASVTATRPDELYHLAAPSFVPESWRWPARTVAAIAAATAALLEAVRDHSPETRTFVAVSSEIFGDAAESPQREDTPCRPGNPYAIAKLAAHQIAGAMRDHNGIHVCSGILYNHESERRPDVFVSRKISRAAAAIKVGLASELVLGDLSVVRDWSFAGDVMHGAWMMLQADAADDYVLASGEPHTVQELAEVAFAHVGLEAHDYIRIDPDLVRPPERTRRVGDSSRARERLGWRPALSFEQLIERMVDADVCALA